MRSSNPRILASLNLTMAFESSKLRGAGLIFARSSTLTVGSVQKVDLEKRASEPLKGIFRFNQATIPGFWPLALKFLRCWSMRTDRVGHSSTPGAFCLCAVRIRLQKKGNRRYALMRYDRTNALKAAESNTRLCEVSTHPEHSSRLWTLNIDIGRGEVAGGES